MMDHMSTGLLFIRRPAYAQDLAFDLEFDDFKWRWDMFRLGPRTSAEVLSKHLIIPLISMTHVAFSSADPISELEESDLEKVD